MTERDPMNQELDDLKAALKELVEAIEVKASARARPETFYSPRMEDAMAKAKKLLRD